jgi:hypothetical protein
MSVKSNIILFFIFYIDFYVRLERLYLPMYLSFLLVEKQMTRHSGGAKILSEGGQKKKF